MTLRRKLAFFQQNKPEYTPLEYLQSSGSQYIDTGVFANVTDNWQIKAGTLSSCNARKIICGSFTNNVEYSSLSLEYTASSQIRMYYGLGGGGVVNDFRTPQQYPNNEKLDITWDSNWTERKSITSITRANGTTNVYTNTITIPVPTAQPNTFRLFLDHRKAGDRPAIANPLRLYYLKIIKNGVVVRDFVPALVNNEPCMYDLVTKKPYYNEGTGEFGYQQ